jgi:hypothetical protein
VTHVEFIDENGGGPGVHGLVDDEGCGDGVVAQGCDEGGDLPMTVRHLDVFERQPFCPCPSKKKGPRRAPKISLFFLLLFLWSKARQAAGSGKIHAHPFPCSMTVGSDGSLRADRVGVFN